MPNVMRKTVASPKNVYSSFAWRETISQMKFFLKDIGKKKLVMWEASIYSSILSQNPANSTILCYI